MSQTLEKVKARINMEEELSGEERSLGRAGGPVGVREGDLHPATRRERPGSLGKSQVDGWQAPRAQSRASLRAGPRLRVVDRSPRTQGTLGAKLPGLCQGQTPTVGENPSGREDRANEGQAGADGQVRQEQNQAKERRQGRLGVPARDNPGQRASQEADRQVRQQPDMKIDIDPEELAHRRALLQRELFNLQQIEEQAQRQSKQHPIDNFSEGET